MSDWRGLPIYSGVNKDSDGGGSVTASRFFPGPPRIRPVTRSESMPVLCLSPLSFCLCFSHHLCLPHLRLTLLSHCLLGCFSVTVSRILYLLLSLTYHLCISVSLAHHLSWSPSLRLSQSLTLSLSLSPALAGPSLGHRVTGRQGACCLFSTLTGSKPSRAAVQESSSRPAPATRLSHHQPLLPAHSVLSRECWGLASRRADVFLPGSSYRTACPGGPAPHQRCPLTPPLLALGLDLPEWDPLPAHPHLRNFAPAESSTWSSSLQDVSLSLDQRVSSVRS